MNNFTKDELKQIMWAIHGEFPIPNFLGNKIQSMIENYCEHEIVEPFFIGDEMHYHCIKCEKEMKDDN